MPKDRQSSHGAAYLLTAETVSNLGWGISQLALPLTAVLLLDAGISQVGMLLLAAGIAPLIGRRAAAGTIDRLGPRNSLIVGNLLRALLLATPALLFALDMLNLLVLGAVAAFTAVAGTVIRPAVRIYLRTQSASEADFLQRNKELSRLYITASAIGFAVGGSAVSLLGPHWALLLNGLTYAVSASVIGRAPKGATQAINPVIRESVEGTDSSAARAPIEVRWLLIIESIAAVGLGLVSAAWTIHLTNTLGIAPWLQGWALAIGAAMGIAGTYYARTNVRSAKFWIIVASAHAVGGVALILLGRVDASLGLLILLLQQLVVPVLASSRDVSVATGRLLATKEDGRTLVETQFYAYPLAGAALGRLLAIPLDPLGTRMVMVCGAVPAALAAAAAVGIALNCRNSTNHKREE